MTWSAPQAKRGLRGRDAGVDLAKPAVCGRQRGQTLAAAPGEVVLVRHVDVKAKLLRAPGGAYLPFADIAEPVTAGLEHLAEGRQLRVHRPVGFGPAIGQAAVLRGIDAGQQRGARRGADWGRAAGFPEVHAFGRQPVEVGRDRAGMAVGTEAVVPVLVDVDQEDVRPYGCVCGHLPLLPSEGGSAESCPAGLCEVPDKVRACPAAGTPSGDARHVAAVMGASQVRAGAHARLHRRFVQSLDLACRRAAWAGSPMCSVS